MELVSFVNELRSGGLIGPFILSILYLERRRISCVCSVASPSNVKVSENREKLKGWGSVLWRLSPTVQRAEFT